MTLVRCDTVTTTNSHPPPFGPRSRRTLSPITRPRPASTTESTDGFRAVVIQGARQVGKTTLANLLADPITAVLVTLDRGDRLILATKQKLDRSPTAGQYILTGSTNSLTTPAISDDRAFSDLIRHDGTTPSREDHLRLVCAGGYPRTPTPRRPEPTPVVRVLPRNRAATRPSRPHQRRLRRRHRLPNRQPMSQPAVARNGTLPGALFESLTCEPGPRRWRPNMTPGHREPSDTCLRGGARPGA